MANIEINGRKLRVPDGTTILEAARTVGANIPVLCHHPDLPVDGSCRMCVVECTGVEEQVAACATPVSDGMQIQTESPALDTSRRLTLELLLRNYHCENAEDTSEFMTLVKKYGARLPEIKQPGRHTVDADPNPFIRIDMNQCILCRRCVRACDAVQGRFVLGVANRGADSQITIGAGSTMLESRCESCGACEAFCPTGALMNRQAYKAGTPGSVVTTTCVYCGVGCQFDLNVKEDRIVGVTSNPQAPLNGMSLCVKGRYGWDFVHHEDRLQYPFVRRYLLEGVVRSPGESRGDWVRVDWETALSITARKFASIKRENGPDAIGVLSSAKCTNEENYLMQKFARQVVGTNNIDHCARLCHSSTVAGLGMAFGSGAMSNSMRDVANESQAIFVIGSNTTEQHPVFGAMIRQAVLQRDVKLVVADPRSIDLCEFATNHLRQAPGTDIALINGLMHLILKNGWHDQKFIEDRCEGFEEFQNTIRSYSPEYVSEVTGVPATQLYAVAELLGKTRPAAVVWAMGITQHTTGVLNVLSLANMQMLLGNMGVPGGGVNPLRGQNNVQGACDMGALPDVLPGYQKMSDVAAVERVQVAWESGQAMPTTQGLTVTEMFDAAGSGRIRGLYLLGEDPVQSEPDTNHLRAMLEATELIVLQEIFPSETSHYADVLLPGVSFAEKSGTFTNTERRVQLVRTAVSPPGEARMDWEITAQVAQRMLREEKRSPTGSHAFWNYGSAAAILSEVAALTPSYAGVNIARLERGDQLQWPVLSDEHPGTPILHVERFTSGKGRFHVTEHLPPRELPDADYPLLLTTGRVLYHWHGGELSRRVEGLLSVHPQPLVEISPTDAGKMGIEDTASIRLRSRRGEVEAFAKVTNRVPPGVLFGNFHFPGVANINNLTTGAVDPVAKIPEYKVCAVSVEPAG